MRGVRDARVDRRRGLSDARGYMIEGIADALWRAYDRAQGVIVDDSAMARRGDAPVLESAGYSVAEAEDGLVAIERYFLG